MESFCRQTLLLIWAYGAIAFIFNTLDEVIPIFASTEIKHGGLSMNINKLSIPLAIGGAVLILNALVIYPIVEKAIGLLRCASYLKLLSLKLTT